MKNIQFLTTQAVFDQAVVHLLGQRKAALLPKGGGAYYGGNSTCPVGNLIAARHYAASMEGVPVRYVSTHTKDIPQHLRAGADALKRALIRARIDIDDNRTVLLLTRLQTVHDAFGVWEWKRRLKSVASEFGLLDGIVATAA
jgi:hypothetical protein